VARNAVTQARNKEQCVKTKIKIFSTLLLVSSACFSKDVQLERFSLNEHFLDGEMKHWRGQLPGKSWKNTKLNRLYIKRRIEAEKKFPSLKSMYKGSLLFRVRGELNNSKEEPMYLKDCQTTKYFFHCDHSYQGKHRKIDRHIFMVKKKRIPHDTPEFYLNLVNYHQVTNGKIEKESYRIKMVNGHLIFDDRALRRRGGFFGITEKMLKKNNIKFRDPMFIPRQTGKKLKPYYPAAYSQIVFTKDYIYFVGSIGLANQLVENEAPESEKIKHSVFYIKDEDKHIPTIDFLPWKYGRLLKGKTDFNKIVGPYLEADKAYRKNR
jgi:hypothetical protein